VVGYFLELFHIVDLFFLAAADGILDEPVNYKIGVTPDGATCNGYSIRSRD
jgi:hypothetical protein